jgi:hypothetical protein
MSDGTFPACGISDRLCRSELTEGARRADGGRESDVVLLQAFGQVETNLRGSRAHLAAGSDLCDLLLGDTSII